MSSESDKPLLSVITCAHNPRSDYYQRALDALKQQTLDRSQWEYLLIDNASKEPLASRFDLSWHPQGRHVHEEQLGLTPARLRAIREARADILVFFDDDNLPEPDYLARVVEIAQQWPFLGAWGGQVIGEFEIPPPAWIQPYLYFLAIHEVERDYWSNIKFQHHSIPCGAGICVRRSVAEQFAKNATSDDRRLALGRAGNKLLAGEDIDLAYTANDLGLGTGQFVALKLHHLIPKNRFDESYFFRLVEGAYYSSVWVEYFHGKLPARPGSKWRLWLRTMRMDHWSGEMLRALYRGKNAAIRDIAARERQSS